jgi:hypothetical protein
VPKPPLSYRRIDQLKQLAFDCNLTAEQAREFGKLSATATWEKLLTAHGLEFDRNLLTQKALFDINTEVVETAHGLEFDRNLLATANAPAPASRESTRQISLLEWVDFGQLIAIALASAGLLALLLSLWPRINPLNLLPPVKIQIQIGASKI